MIIKSKIKKGDNIIVIAGKDKNKTGEVLKVYPKDLKVLVQGVNIVKKHQKPTANNAGGIVEKELPIHVSNVAFLDPKQSKPTKVGYKIEDGKKVRYAKLSGTVLDA
jgi:large subunit ribosomal protein L24